MKVARLPDDPGPAGWMRILPEQDASPALAEDVKADWLVIGAGFAGLAATHRLSQLCPSDKIVLLDATRVGHGPAGRNSGFMIDLPHDLASEDYGGTLDADRAQIEDNRRAIAFAAEMVDTYGLTREAFDPCGKTNGAATDKGHQHNLDYKAHLDALGEESHLLDAQQMRDMTGTNYYKSGIFTPGAVMLQPAQFVQAVARGVQSNRVRMHENSPVVELVRDGDWCATTPNGSVRAHKVILAVNGHLESFGFARRQLLHTHTYASMTRALNDAEIARLGGAERWNLIPADPMGTTLRRISGTGGTRLVVRNRFTCDPDLAPGPNWQARITRDHDRAFAARFPMLTGVDMQYRWGGRLCISLNNVQLVGEVDTNLYSACCQNGLGTAKGTLAGLLAAELACGVDSPALRRAQNAPPPKALPPKWITKLGATARIRLAEYRAGAEK